MNKFTHRPRSLEEILKLCKEQDLEVDMANLGSSGYVTIRGGDAFAHYNPVSGNFIGTTPDGIHFHAGNRAHAKKEWFLALLDFFHTEIR